MTWLGWQISHCLRMKSEACALWRLSRRFFKVSERSQQGVKFRSSVKFKVLHPGKFSLIFFFSLSRTSQWMLQLQISKHELVKTHSKLCQESAFKAMLSKSAALGGLDNSESIWFSETRFLATLNFRFFQEPRLWNLFLKSNHTFWIYFKNTYSLPNLSQQILQLTTSYKQ